MCIVVYTKKYNRLESSSISFNILYIPHGKGILVIKGFIIIAAPSSET